MNQNRHRFLLTVGAAVTLAVSAFVAVAGESEPEFRFTRQRLFPGFDGKTCKIQPAFASDGKGLVLLSWQNLLLSGSDVFYGQSMVRSTDGGRTWSAPVEQKALADTWEGKIRIAHYGQVQYNVRTRRWFGLGGAQCYENDKVPMNVRLPSGTPPLSPLFLTVDPQKGEFTSYRPLAVPFPFDWLMPFGQTVELDDGDILVPFYGRAPGKTEEHTFSIVVRYRFKGDELVPVEAGEPVSDTSYSYGIVEPSLIRAGRKFYLTLRTGTEGLWAESGDGLHFGKPRPWTWTTGGKIGNVSTQQHWMKVGETLYLAYTRETPTNGHIFLNRAPLFLARFDPEKGGLVRDSEIPLVPELGARLGNFVCQPVGDEFWLATAEWMQSWKGYVPADYGSDNSIWLVKIGPKVKRGALCLTFDDRFFTSWFRELPRLKKHNAHATFFIWNNIDDEAIAAMRRFKAEGHSLGLHGVKHVRAAETMAKVGKDAYLAAEIDPQIAAAKAAGFDIRNFAYPESNRDEATDAALLTRFDRVTCGCIWRKEIANDPISFYDQVYVPRTEAKSRGLLWRTAVMSEFRECLSDVEVALWRAHARDEVVVLYIHDVCTGEPQNGLQTSSAQLEGILELADRIGVPVIGFDEL